MTGRRILAVIVSYRSATLTIGCLRSLQAERARAHPTLRCVVVDNASDDAPAIAQAIASNGWGDWVDLVVAPRNGGFAYGNNLGLRSFLAHGDFDYAYLINPDAQAHPGAIQALVDFLDARPAAGIAGGIFENPDGSEWAYAFHFPSLLSELESALQLGIVSRLLRDHKVPIPMGREARRVDWVSGAAMMVRREVFERIGGLDEGFFLYFEETEFCWRASRCGYEAWYVPDSRVTHIGGQSTDIGAHHARPRRLPGYWYESRRRFFRLAHGAGYAMVVDAVALAAGVFGLAKRICTGRFSHGVPRWLRDLYAHSLLRAGNRKASVARVVPGLKRAD